MGRNHLETREEGNDVGVRDWKIGGGKGGQEG